MQFVGIFSTILLELYKYVFNNRFTLAIFVESFGTISFF